MAGDILGSEVRALVTALEKCRYPPLLTGAFLGPCSSSPRTATTSQALPALSPWAFPQPLLSAS